MRRRTTIYIENNKYKDLKKIAIDDDKSVTDVIDEAITQYMERRKNKEMEKQ